MLRRRTSAHSGAKTGTGRSQLLTQAFQASNSASSSKPGNSAQRTASQRLLPCTSGAGKGPESPGRLPAGVGSPAGADEGGCGGLAQEASKAVMAIIVPSRIERFSCPARIDGIQGNVMA